MWQWVGGLIILVTVMSIFDFWHRRSQENLAVLLYELRLIRKRLAPDDDT